MKNYALWLVLALWLMLASCKAKDCNQAVKRAKELDPNARCVDASSSSNERAHCVIHGQPYVCDKDDCVPTGAVLPAER